MKIEREVRFLNIDVKDTVARLKDLGAHKGYEGVMRTTSYDIGTPGLPLIISAHSGKGTAAVIDKKAHEFYQIHIDDTDELRQVCDRIGIIEKKRGLVIPKRIQRLEERGMRLRVRSKSRTVHPTSKGEITLKTDTVYKKVKESTEYEIALHPYGECREILQRVGMRELRTYDKRRTEYIVESGISVVLDTLVGIPTYIEIEGDSIDDIARTANALGHRMKDACLLTTRELRALYTKKR